MSLHPYALRSSSKSAGIPSSRDGVFSICSKEAKGYRVDAMSVGVQRSAPKVAECLSDTSAHIVRTGAAESPKSARTRNF